jgi:hypothetical protein
VLIPIALLVGGFRDIEKRSLPAIAIASAAAGRDYTSAVAQQAFFSISVLALTLTLILSDSMSASAGQSAGADFDSYSAFILKLL